MRYIVMSQAGDSQREFKPEEEAIARRVFEDLTGKPARMLAYVPQGEGAHRQVKSFDELSPDAEVLFSPQLQAG